MTILDLLDASIAERGPAPAIDDVTYDDLAAGVVRVAQRLRARGLGAGDRIALYCENRLAFVYTYLAALRLGAIAVPANVLYRSSDLAHVITDCAASLMLVSAQTQPFLAGISVPPAVVADEVETWARDRAIDAQPFPPASADAPAVIVYTSGTTGRSKGAVLTHANLAVIAAQLTTAWRWTARDTLAIALPLFHVHGLCAGLNGTLACGGRLLLQPRFEARAMLAVLQRPSVTMFFGVPTMYVRLLELPDPVAFPALRLCVSGSAALSPETFERFRTRFGITILERYGATEFGFALGNRFAGPRVPGSVGVPFPGVRVRIAPADSGSVAGGGAHTDGESDGRNGIAAAQAFGGVGELLVNGPNVFSGYWRDPNATAAAFTVDAAGERWYHSGDLAAYDMDQHVYRIVGRSKDLIVSGGFNVYPLEVENEIDRFPGVGACAVIGAPDAVRGESVVAFVEAHAPFEAADLIAWLQPRLASFKLPKRIEFVDALPRNALGKVEKTKLRALV